MPAFIYTGPDAFNTIRGVTFARGEVVEIENKSLAAKLAALPYFTAETEAQESPDAPVLAASADPQETDATPPRRRRKKEE